MDIQAYWNNRDVDFSGPHKRLAIIADLIGSITPPPRNVLDVGCAGGGLGQVLPKHIEYFGIDIASEFIQTRNDPTHFAVVDLDDQPAAFGSQKFDLVVCSGIFEYINHRNAFLMFVGSKLVPQGHLVMSFTNRQHKSDLQGWLTGRQREYKDPHVNFMTIPALKRLLRKVGFSILRSICLTAKHRVLPVSGNLMRFPFNVLVRQYIFVCRSDV